jgi:DMSO/TMAO reductase YedYZ molybdopterin-dependent catalytic subunit
LLVGAERGSIAVLVAAAVFQLASGLANSAQWYPWSFSFRATHFAMGWVAIGAMVLHIAVKLPVIRQALTSDLDDTGADRAGASSAGALTRRGLLRSTWVAAGAAVVLSAGSTVPLLRQVSVFGVRSGRGPDGMPINTSAAAAAVISTALNPAYRLWVTSGGRSLELSRDQLRAMPQTSAVLPIACVEGWSASGTWQGVRVRDLLALVDAPTDRDVRVVSLQQEGAFRETILPAHFAADPLTLLALKLNDEELAIDHGYPVRLIAPNRPGVLQTKWVARLEVSA